MARVALSGGGERAEAGAGARAPALLRLVPAHLLRLALRLLELLGQRRRLGTEPLHLLAQHLLVGLHPRSLRLQLPQLLLLLRLRAVRRGGRLLQPAQLHLGDVQLRVQGVELRL